MEDLEAAERARALFGPRDDPRLWADVNAQICNSLRYGPVPAGDAIARIEALADEGSDRGLLLFTSALLAMEGRIDEARARARAGRAYLEERGLLRIVGVHALHAGSLEGIAGNFEGAASALEEGIAILQSMGETGVLSTLAAMRATALYRLGRRDETEASIRLAQETGAENDIATQVDWRVAAAQLAADEARVDDAERIIGEALELVEPTDFLELRGGAFEALAHVEARAGRPDGWKAALERSLGEHERKGNIMDARRVRDLLTAGPPEPIANAPN
jgi:hypothetical protein